MRHRTALAFSAALLIGTTSAALAQPPTPGLVDSPCPPPDPEAAARLAPVDELFMTPAASPEAFWKAFEAWQASLPKTPPGEAEARRARDWPQLCRYKADNAALPKGARPRAVLMGDSITDNWTRGDPAFFTNGVIGRGIGGQTSPQMLARFRQDVVALHPRVVHIMAGTNDIAGNTGPTTVADYQSNILAMIELARANDIAVVLAGIPPSRKLYWRGDLDPRPLIRELNGWLRNVAFNNGYVWVDYATVLADAEGGLRASLSNDGVHPNRVGYARMRPLTERAITEALERATASAGARPSLARREELLASVAASVAPARTQQRPPNALAPPPTPPKSANAWTSAPTLPLWPAAPPGGTFVPATLPAGWPAPFVLNVATPELRVFKPQRANGQAVLAIPGGGYQFVSVQNEGADFAAKLTERGYTVFVLVYRLPGEGWQQGEDVPLQDAQRAMRVIRADAARWSVDPRTLSIVGFSAGGHLAATLATDFAQPVYAPVDAADAQSARPFAAALIYPVVTMALPGTHAVSRELLLGPNPTPSQVTRRSAQLHVGADTPPLYLVHALDDPAVPVANSLDLLAAMRAANRPVEAHLLQEGGHAFASGYPGSPTATWIATFDAWLTRLRTTQR
ncbi:MAG TPA: GDSL-type esterase/lipase family protein [Gammaproteobacteria bacterium]|nr:GDSL-type esterase/lipase family protein [Gammaproteobacteria bacterium]